MGLRVDALIFLALFVSTFVLYLTVRQFDFVNFDDPDYVTGNLHVRAGLTVQSIGWAFRSTDAANWLPVTRLSHTVDSQLFGMQSGMHHLVNVSLHAIAVLLLFAFLNRATQARWPSAFVAFVFACHPLHVESVAWVAERKDVLSALFGFLTLWAYVRYTERQTTARYLFTMLAFALGLMSKPMLVTVPFLLLLIDFWPLRRVLNRRIVLEKIPFFVVSAAIALVTYLVQRRAGAAEAVHASAGLRIENALLSYVLYIGKMLLPVHLAVFYPFPSHLPMWQPLAAAFLVAAATVFVVQWRRRYPFLATGWFWYVGTLLPVIGLAQVGAQARADRYTYIPMVGLSIMLAWGAVEIARKWPSLRTAFVIAGAAACLGCMAVTRLQLEYWQNSERLFDHALKVTGENYLAEHNLGDYLLNQPGRLPDAVVHLQNAVRLRPDSVKARTDLGTALSRMPDHLSEAVAEYEAALQISPNSAITHNDLANTISKIPGKLPQAIEEYRKALQLDPDYAEAHNNLAVALEQAGKLPEAIAEFQQALRLDPEYAHARNNLALAYFNFGVSLSKAGNNAQAIRQFESALRVRPDYAEAHNDIAVLLANIPGRMPDAIAHWQAALRIDPSYADAQANLQMAQHAESQLSR